MTPESLTTRLHDIQELDAVGIWPLAAGWWLLLAVLVLIILLFIGLRRRRIDWQAFLPRYGWSRDAARELMALRERVGRAETKSLVAQFSELLRRIAIARCGRESCAGLHGEHWLNWLAAHDPDGFDWREHGSLLLDIPYAPPAELEPQTAMYDLIDAALVWTRQAGTCPGSRGHGHGV